MITLFSEILSKPSFQIFLLYWRIYPDLRGVLLIIRRYSKGSNLVKLVRRSKSCSLRSVLLWRDKMGYVWACLQTGVLSRLGMRNGYTPHSMRMSEVFGARKLWPGQDYGLCRIDIVVARKWLWLVNVCCWQCEDVQLLSIGMTAWHITRPVHLLTYRI